MPQEYRWVRFTLFDGAFRWGPELRRTDGSKTRAYLVIIDSQAGRKYELSARGRGPDAFCPCDPLLDGLFERSQSRRMERDRGRRLGL